MKAVVLAAGLGTRLRPLTNLRPKALCPVANTALLDWNLGRVRALGLTDDAIAVNAHWLGEQIVEHLAGTTVHVSFERDELLGTAGAVGKLREWLDGHDALVVNADAWHPAPLDDLVGEPRALRLLVVDGPRDDFDGRTFAGASLLTWRDASNLEPVPSSLYDEVWKGAADRRTLVLAPGPWFDCGTPADYLAANLEANGGESVIGAGALVQGEVRRSVVWPGATVKPGERLVGAIRLPDGTTVIA